MDGPILLLGGSFLACLAIGVPIAVSIGIATVATMLLAMPAAPALTTTALRMATGIDSFALLAIPFFILSGQLISQGGMAQRLVDFAKALVGGFAGGLAFVNILASMFFGTISGSAVAATSAVGGFMIPSMEKEGYDRETSVAVTMTGSVTGLLIPPSNILIVYSLASGGVSIAALFLAGYVPGILLGLGLMVVAGLIARRRGYPIAGPSSWGEGIRAFFRAAPSLLLIIIVMGGIVAGIFTATEASAIAVVYSLLLAVVVYREVQIRDLPEILLKSSETTAIVMLLIATSVAMSWILSYENIPQDLTAFLLNLTESRVMILLLINLLLLVVGTFMDITPAVLIFTPIFLPVAAELGISPLHFGIMMVLNLCIGLCTPPVGSILFVGCGIGKTTVPKTSKALLPFYAVMVLVLFLVVYRPWLSEGLPVALGYGV
ncbi:MAG: TRAP transporter large permease [Gemmatimonadetes bacterium]|nr:TRAP transporter large permease [Gemmatimonadota bacterium]